MKQITSKPDSLKQQILYLLSHIVSEDQESVSGLAGGSHPSFSWVTVKLWSELQSSEGLTEPGGPTSKFTHVAVGRNPQFLATWTSPQGNS